MGALTKRPSISLPPNFHIRWSLLQTLIDARFAINDPIAHFVIFSC